MEKPLIQTLLEGRIFDDIETQDNEISDEERKRFIAEWYDKAFVTK